MIDRAWFNDDGEPVETPFMGMTWLAERLGGHSGIIWYPAGPPLTPRERVRSRRLLRGKHTWEDFAYAKRARWQFALDIDATYSITNPTTSEAQHETETKEETRG